MKKILLLLLTIFLLLLGLAQIAYIGLYPHLLFSFCVFFLLAIIVIKKNILNRKKALLLLPFLLLLCIYIVAIIDHGFQNSLYGFFKENLGWPMIAASIVAIFLGVLFCSGRVHRLISLGLFGVVFISLIFTGDYLIKKWLHNMSFNTFDGLVMEEEPQWKALLEDSILIDQNSFDKKILVLDFWYTACNVCFRDFPVFDSLRKQYLNDSNFVFYSMNYRLKDETPEENFELIKKENYSFPVGIMDSNSIDNFSISAYPTVIVIKNKQIRYRGSVHFLGVFLEDLKREEKTSSI